MSSFAPSVLNAAAAVRRTAARGGGLEDVVDLIEAERLAGDERVALLQVLLEDPAGPGPHPADLAVCAFVFLGYEEFRRMPRPDVLIDLRST